MNPFVVVLFEDPGDTIPIWFDCYADDDVHAAEQAQDAYPGCKILDVRPLAIFVESAAAREEVIQKEAA